MSARLSRNVALSMLNAGAVMGTAVVAVPLILDRVGAAGFGAWTLAGTVIVYASILETAIGPSLQRDVAVSLGSGEHSRIHRTLWTLLLLYLCLGGAVFGLLHYAGPSLAGILDLRPALLEEARTAYRTLGVPLALVLLASGLGNFLQGLGRFVPVAASTAVGGAVYVAMIQLLVGSGELSDLVWAASVQQGVVCLLRAGALARFWLARGGPRLLARSDVRRLVGFSARLQPTAIAELFNWQSDKVVVGVVAPATTLANLGIGMQLSDAGRIVAGSTLNPIVTSFARLAGAGDTEGLRAAFARIHHRWSVSVFGGAVILAANVYPLVRGWVGSTYGDAAAFAALLILGSAFWLSAGIGVAYMRAVGRVGLEARFASLILVSNICLTVVMAILLGAFGAVLGTVGAYAAGALFFFRRLSREIEVNPLGSAGEGLRVLVAALACAAGSFGWGLAMSSVVPEGVALVPIGLGIAAAGVLYVRLALGVRLDLRRLLVIAGRRRLR